MLYVAKFKLGKYLITAIALTGCSGFGNPLNYIDYAPLLDNVTSLSNFPVSTLLDKFSNFDYNLSHVNQVSNHIFRIRISDPIAINFYNFFNSNSPNIKIILGFIIGGLIYSFVNIIIFFVNKAYDIINSLCVYIKNMMCYSDTVKDSGNDSRITVKPSSKGKSGINQSNTVNTGSGANGDGNDDGDDDDFRRNQKYPKH